jgi:hypothetical protein
MKRLTALADRICSGGHHAPGHYDAGLGSAIRETQREGKVYSGQEALDDPVVRSSGAARC